MFVFVYKINTNSFIKQSQNVYYNRNSKVSWERREIVLLLMGIVALKRKYKININK